MAVMDGESFPVTDLCLRCGALASDLISGQLADHLCDNLAPRLDRLAAARARTGFGAGSGGRGVGFVVDGNTKAAVPVNAADVASFERAIAAFDVVAVRSGKMRWLLDELRRLRAAACEVPA